MISWSAIRPHILDSTSASSRNMTEPTHAVGYSVVHGSVCLNISCKKKKSWRYKLLIHGSKKGLPFLTPEGKKVSQVTLLQPLIPFRNQTICSPNVTCLITSGVWISYKLAQQFLSSSEKWCLVVWLIRFNLMVVSETKSSLMSQNPLLFCAHGCCHWCFRYSRMSAGGSFFT